MHESRRSGHRLRKFLLLIISAGVAFKVGRDLARQSADQPDVPPTFPRPATPENPSTTETAAPVAPTPSDGDKAEDSDPVTLSAIAEQPGPEVEANTPFAFERESELDSDSESQPESESPSEPEPDADPQFETEATSEVPSESEPGAVSESDAGMDTATSEDPGADSLGSVDSRIPTGVQALTGGACPLEHPIKARFSTGRYHRPEDDGYERVVADCCYKTVEEAEADGFTQSQW